MKYVVPPPLHTLKIWGAGVNSPRNYGAEFLSFFCMFVRHAQKAYTVRIRNELRGNRHKPPGQKSPRAVLVFVPIFVFVLVIVLVIQQAATYSIAAVAGN